MTDSPSTEPPLREGDGLSLPLRVGELANRGGLRFHLLPSTESRQTLADELDAVRIRKLEFRGRVVPEGRQDWRLEGVLGATVVQSCVITAEPVTTRIDETIVRRYLRDMPMPTEVEAEIPEDDSMESLGPVIDPGAVMA
ncbi:MAG: hypothetical protein KDK12_20565, partial [Rhodobacteraceae bacterium]|nr:hypothetical protein [Paracoccaceae bacterium]